MPPPSKRLKAAGGERIKGDGVLRPRKEIDQRAVSRVATWSRTISSRPRGACSGPSADRAVGRHGQPRQLVARRRQHKILMPPGRTLGGAMPGLQVIPRILGAYRREQKLRHRPDRVPDRGATLVGHSANGADDASRACVHNGPMPTLMGGQRSLILLPLGDQT